MNFCDVRAKRLGIEDPKCKTNHTEIQSYLKNVKGQFKFLRNFFNPETFAKNNYKMDFVAEHRKGDVTGRDAFILAQNNIDFFNSPIFDFSPFKFLPHIQLRYFSSRYNFFAQSLNSNTDPTIGLQ